MTLLLLCANSLIAGEVEVDETEPPAMPQRVIEEADWDFLLPSEKTLLSEYQNLAPEDLKTLLPSEQGAADAKKGAAIAAAFTAKYKEWCEKNPVRCAEIAKAQAEADEAERIRQQQEQQRLANARAQSAKEADQKAARDLVQTVRTDIFMGRSRSEINTELFLLPSGGSETEKIKSQMGTNLFMQRSILEGVYEP